MKARFVRARWRVSDPPEIDFRHVLDVPEAAASEVNADEVLLGRVSFCGLEQSRCCARGETGGYPVN